MYSYYTGHSRIKRYQNGHRSSTQNRYKYVHKHNENHTDSVPHDLHWLWLPIYLSVHKSKSAIRKVYNKISQHTNIELDYLPIFTITSLAYMFIK